MSKTREEASKQGKKARKPKGKDKTTGKKIDTLHSVRY